MMQGMLDARKEALKGLPAFPWSPEAPVRRNAADAATRLWTKHVVALANLLEANGLTDTDEYRAAAEALKEI